MACLEIWETPAALKQNARARRLAQLVADIENSRAALSAERDQGHLLELMKQHVSLQDALVDELLLGTPRVAD